MIQDNTKTGMLALPVSADLSGKENHLVKMTATGLALTAAATDPATYVVVSGAALGDTADVVPLSGERNISVVVSEAVAVGDSLAIDTGNAGQAVVAAVSTAAFGVVEIATGAGGTAIVRPIQHTTPAA